MNLRQKTRHAGPNNALGFICEDFLVHLEGLKEKTSWINDDAIGMGIQIVVQKLTSSLAKYRTLHRRELVFPRGRHPIRVVYLGLAAFRRIILKAKKFIFIHFSLCINWNDTCSQTVTAFVSLIFHQQVTK